MQYDYNERKYSSNMNILLKNFCVAWLLVQVRIAASLDEFDERVEFCKHHLSPVVDEEKKHRSLQAEHGIRTDSRTVREEYSTIKECFRAKFFDPYREDSNEILSILQTSGNDFQTRLNDVDRNVTKLVIEVATQRHRNFAYNKETGTHINLTYLAVFFIARNSMDKSASWRIV